MLNISLPAKPVDSPDYESVWCLPEELDNDNDAHDRQFSRTPRLRENVTFSRLFQRRWASLGLSLTLIVATSAFLLVRSRHSVDSSALHKHEVQKKFGDWVINILWGHNDPFKFKCPLPWGLMATDWDAFKANNYRPLNSTKLSAHFGPVVVQTKDGSLHIGMDKTPETCCRYYNWSWWPYVYPECESIARCDSCWKASPVSQLESSSLGPFAGVAWAASTNVYEDHHEEALPGLGLSQKQNHKMLVSMATGKRTHMVDACSQITDLEQTTFDYESLKLRVRASRSVKDKLAIIAFRGTLPSEFMNWWVDLNTAVTPFNLGGAGKDGPITNVHKGYLDALHTLLKNLRHWVDGDLFGVGQIPSDWTLLFTGHSMGGAFAILAATMVFVEAWNRVPDAVITFGNPRVADKVLSDWWQEQGLCDRLMRINVYNDGVHLVPFNEQSPSYKDIQRCNKDIGDCMKLEPSRDLQSLWVPVCPASEFLVPGAVKGMNEHFQDFNWYGASLAHTMSQCRFGYAYGLFKNGIALHDRYCGLSQDMCPEFTCTTVEDLKGKQCVGLTEYSDIHSAADCKETCCSHATCEVWLWVNKVDKTSFGKAASKQCWMGRSDRCEDWTAGADKVLEGGRIK